MEPRTLKGRILAYTLLAAGSFLFLFPFVWLVSTSLKPNEQATTMPPRWIPQDHRAPVRGEMQRVVLGEPLSAPMLIVRIDEGPSEDDLKLVETDNFKDGQLLTTVAGIEQWIDATVIKRAEKGWRYIEERREIAAMGDEPAWDVVPADVVESDTQFFWSNYPRALDRMGKARVYIPLLGVREISVAWIYLKNTLIICTLGVAGTVLSSSLVAYSLARIPWRGRGVLFALTLATMMVPFPVLMVPLYTLFKSFGWIGTLLPLWVPYCMGTGFNIFLLRQFFLTIPRDLSEAARIDGCSEFGIYLRVILPLSKPALAVVALFHFLFSWNDFMGPLLYLTRPEDYTLSLGLQAFQSQQGGTDWSSLMAASTLICLPIIVLFFFTQKTFIKGIATTGIKG